METRSIAFCSFLSALGASVQAEAATTIIRPGECAGVGQSYLLAVNSGAIIRVAPGNAAAPEVIVFRPKAATGWASQRLLMRFDLQLDDHGARIINSGAFCKE